MDNNRTGLTAARDAEGKMPTDEHVIRICPETGRPVMAVHEGDGIFLCLHNDSPEEDAQAVRNWIESNGKNPDPDKAIIHCRV